jgi:hypothetical protein
VRPGVIEVGDRWSNGQWMDADEESARVFMDADEAINHAPAYGLRSPTSSATQILKPRAGMERTSPCGMSVIVRILVSISQNLESV